MIFEHVEKSHHYRGKFISHFTSLENNIEYFLINYFIPEKRNGSYKKRGEFREIVIDRMTFEAKRTSMRSIVDSFSETVGEFIKTKNNSYPHSKLFDEIRLLNDQRNYFAHYGNEVYLTEDFVLDDFVIGLAERRDKKQTRKYTLSDFNSLIERLNKAAEAVNNLTLLICQREPE